MSTAPCPSTRGDRGVVALATGWQLARTAPGECTDAAATTALSWSPATVPGTVAMSLGADVTTPGLHDADDWWYRCGFQTEPTGHSVPRRRLRFEGLATLAEVWLNGRLILQSANMFVPHTVDVTEHLQAHNELIICLRSLDRVLAQRKPRPRWKTSLVPSQHLRWVRTTLLGRMPGWTPPIHPVGVWKPVLLETLPPVSLGQLDLQASLDGDTGHVSLRADLVVAEGVNVDAARLCVGDSATALTVVHDGAPQLLGSLSLPEVPAWWPHTHGTPATLTCRIELRVDGVWSSIDYGRIGFRQLKIERAHGLVQLQINGVPIFCRGACWTTDDLLALHGDTARLRRTLELARDAGLNMLRIGGTMAYESDAFYALCDELGILVWQDFMFANMDYPVADEAFLAEITREAVHQLNRLQKHACIAAYCGGSEVEQQAAMLGLPASEWSNPFFAEALPALCARWHAGVPYFRSSPCEGALPFHVATGISHYYGVGAYKRPLTDVKSAGVKFSTECLGFSHVPEPETIELMMGGTVPPAHHPLWKARQPRDVGAGWDFEDIRDHYLRELFGLDPVRLRSHDTPRYLALSRVVTGEVMRRVYAEWRSSRSVCGGALVWFLKDVWPGAGWGVIDSTGRPKAAYWYLKRAWAPRSIGITDEGLDGLQMHVVNDSAEPLDATVEFTLYQHGRVRVASGSTPVHVEGRGAVTLSADAMLGRFADTAYAYRFGPPPHDVAVARLMLPDGRALSDDFHFPLGLDLPMQQAAALSATAERQADGSVLLKLSSDTFLQSVHIDCAGFTPDDAHFHLAPGTSRQVVFRAADGQPAKFKAHVGALNIRESITLRTD